MDVLEVVFGAGIILFAIGYLFGYLFNGSLLPPGAVTNSIQNTTTGLLDAIEKTAPTVITVILISIVVGVFILLYVLVKKARGGKGE